MQSSWSIPVVVVLALAVSGCASAPYFINNIHTVVPGTVYRSAQLSPEKLTRVIEKHKVRSVLNLRGAFPGQPWYDGERAAAAEAGIAHYDYELSSKVEVGANQAEELIKLMREAPKPLLIHCWGGADRTGLASALYLYSIDERPADEASGALSVKYHHLSFTSAGAMDRSFARFVEQKSAALRLTQQSSASVVTPAAN